MKTSIAIDKLCECAPFIADIADKVKTDEELKEVFVKLSKSDRIGMLRNLPLLIKKCDNEVYGILSILNDKSIEEIKEQDFGITIKEIIAAVKDKDIQSFFTASTQSVEKAAEDTEE